MSTKTTAVVSAPTTIVSVLANVELVEFTESEYNNKPTAYGKFHTYKRAINGEIATRWNNFRCSDASVIAELRELNNSNARFHITFEMGEAPYNIKNNDGTVVQRNGADYLVPAKRFIITGIL
jgi:hypothetical protein